MITRQKRRNNTLPTQMESEQSNDDNSIAHTLTDNANPPTVAASGTSASNDENTSHFNTARTSAKNDDDDTGDVTSKG